MLQLLKRYSEKRGFWFFTAFVSFCFVLFALYFQYILLIPPCVLCIYERCAFFGLIGASLLSAIYPASLLRYPGILLWIYSSGKGLQLAWKHVKIASEPNHFHSCTLLFMNFPSWFSLDKWLPALFAPYGDCSIKSWQFMSLDIPQWLHGIFAIYLLAGILMLVSQFVKPGRDHLFRRY